ncbi:(2E,6E)-farnesyl diphosphate synthase [Endozoicomonas sp. OPT23]|uniref:(2E,6E)-farnesyl diphosphate synthase n=1 Tax=Endozoicomonas sp. OPT23 TaxID=2072845 RepID=UPI00129A8299|nr:farnesyl diphosphate synthase [Endozoicomonas sp. OPT23]MRI32785.1 (2E,6E)-farnesyl diphosphate synthase [Endozoicomonas sp. OPT23]
MILQEYMNTCRTRVDEQLKLVLPESSIVSPKLAEAMTYSVFNGGKRVRPLLVYAANKALGGQAHHADPAACAVELIHAYSLVHDDLPAMDDDDLRRGKPTCHKAFDEATAILAGDALQTLAFEALSTPYHFPEALLSDTARLALFRELTSASGHAGMCGGQSMDLNSVGQALNQQQLQLMHNHKTGALIRASVIMGALSTDKVTDEELDTLTTYANAIGLAFQVQDDILDVTADTETLGKQQGADDALDKPTYVSLMGLEAAQHFAEELCQEALTALSSFDEQAAPLRQLAEYIVHRSH